MYGVALWQWLMCKVETKEGKSWQGKDIDRATRENLSDEKRHGFRRPLILDVFDIPMWETHLGLRSVWQMFVWNLVEILLSGLLDHLKDEPFEATKLYSRAIFFQISFDDELLLAGSLITGRFLPKTDNWEAAGNKQEVLAKKHKDLIENAWPGSRKHEETQAVANKKI